MNNVKQSNAKANSEEERMQANLDRIKHKLIIISGKGGVGKSTVAVNVALGLAAKGHQVGILDVDIHGPSIAKMLGIEKKTLMLAKGEEYPKPVQVAKNLYALSIATLMPSPDEPIVWRGPLKMGAIKQFLRDINWPPLDYLIIDSPPGTGDEPLSIIQLLKSVDGSLVVSTPQDVALLDARKTIKFSQKMNVPVMGLIENMSTFICPHCGKKTDIFKGTGVKKAAKDFGLDILGSVPIDAAIVESGDRGSSFLEKFKENQSAKEISKIIDKIEEKVR
ncbi:MAG: Mrp/NBP35 family ATP-binding protein [Candidatus Cloacimonadota bacterium]|nr:Mrp/NBP35 family ATP-binding protein [Candidatus Cloacimonadota bacterium]